MWQRLVSSLYWALVSIGRGTIAEAKSVRAQTIKTTRAALFGLDVSLTPILLDTFMYSPLVNKRLIDVEARNLLITLEGL